MWYYSMRVNRRPLGSLCSLYHQILFWCSTSISEMLLEQVGLKMFLGVTASVSNWDAEGTTCSLILEDNPLVDFVELPDTCQGLYYCNILSGVIRGALEMVSYHFGTRLIRLLKMLISLMHNVSISVFSQYLLVTFKFQSFKKE